MSNIIKKTLKKLFYKYLKDEFNDEVKTEIQKSKSPTITRYLEKYTSNHLNLLNHFNENKVLQNNKIKVLDIGCSGGIDNYWDKFKDVEVYGIDCVKSEIENLNNNNKNNNYKYFNYYIDLGKDQKPEKFFYETLDKNGSPVLRRKGNQNSLTFNDTAAWRFMESGIKQKKTDIFKDKIFPFIHNTADKLKYVERISIDKFCEENNFKDVNFLKIDTDGYSLQVLKSAEKLIQNKNLLALKVEVNFSWVTQNDFYIDTCDFLTKRNFQLLRIMPRRYETYELPGKFMYDFPAQSLDGFDNQGDVIFIKIPDQETIENLDYFGFLKFLVILELLEMSGFAIKLIKLSGTKFLDKNISEKYINILTKHMSRKITGKELEHKDYLKKIIDNNKLVFPEN